MKKTIACCSAEPCCAKCCLKAANCRIPQRSAIGTNASMPCPYALPLTTEQTVTSGPIMRRRNRTLARSADSLGIDIRSYRIIYKLIEDIEQAVIGMLEPEFEEQVTGEAEVREIFRVPRLGAIAGCMVVEGTIERKSRVRLLREGVVTYDGRVGSLKRFKEDVKEVKEGYECGVGLENFNDVKVGDGVVARFRKVITGEVK